jgi:hypothetical protein
MNVLLLVVLAIPGGLATTLIATQRRAAFAVGLATAVAALVCATGIGVGDGILLAGSTVGGSDGLRVLTRPEWEPLLAPGAARTGAPNAAFHDNRSDWMLVHSRAARRSIETCASCHRQEDCLKCHSASGFARIQPHPAGLDLNHIRSKNPGVCLLCHPGGPPPTP